MAAMPCPYHLRGLTPGFLGGSLSCILVLGAAIWLVARAPSGDVDQRNATTADETVDDRQRWAPIAWPATGASEWRLPRLNPFLGEPDGPMLPYRAGFEPPPRDISYEDPTGSEVPLTWIADRAHRHLTPGFRVADFAARDGAPLARISPDLVTALERLRKRVGDLDILSGYRHPAYNVGVGGVAGSQHQAGKAADIRAPDLEPEDLALLALDEMGCEIGLGLGSRSLHVDVRGELTTWTYADAPIEGPAFAVLVRTRCGLPVSDSLAQLAREAGLALDVLEALESEAATSDAAAGARLEDHLDLLRAVANEENPLQGPGAVVLDLRRSAEAPEPYYLPADDPAIEEFRLERLVEFSAARRGAGYVPYVILTDDRSPHKGILSVRTPAEPEGDLQSGL